MNKTASYTIVGLSANLKGEAQAFLADLEQNRWEVMLCSTLKKVEWILT